MSIVALKRKINAKKNISKTPISSFKVYDSSPGVNSKRGLVARTSGTVVNRNSRVQGRSYHPHMPNPSSIKTATNVNVSQQVGFSLNGTKNVRGTVQRDSNLAYQFEKPGCCSDDGTTIKKTVTGTKGMLDSKKYRNENCCPKTHKEKVCEKKSLKQLEKQTKTASENIADRKHRNENCICIVSSDQPKPCNPKCHKQIHINHGQGTVQSSSDYILQKKARTQYKINKTDESLFSGVDCDSITSSDSGMGIDSSSDLDSNTMV